MVDSDHQSEAPRLPPYPVNEDEISMPPIGHIEEKLGNVLATLRQVDTVIRHLPRADWHDEACRRIANTFPNFSSTWPIGGMLISSSLAGYGGGRGASDS